MNKMQENWIFWRVFGDFFVEFSENHYFSEKIAKVVYYFLQSSGLLSQKSLESSPKLLYYSS